MRIILLGMPGAGKGTQAQIIEEELAIANISTGAILREVSKSKSDLGQKVQSYLNSGQLVPDEIIIEMLVQRISKDDCNNGFILDGFPRNIEQAKSLDQAGVSIDLVIYLKILEEQIIERMSGRRIHLASGRSYHTTFNPPKVDGKDDLTGEDLIQRSDDKPDVIRKRLEVYFNETEPMLDFYKNRDIQFHEIDASESVKAVTEKILKIIN
ncbi:MAG: adenylate kinase [SAR86 cluster bacterium]|uniref:Adenylate kinase n=1 Tax=SAR86 cluster bacterium TaxID=2030880 RepID=A0A368BNE9_9GAMM|nr:MAG: adenylate kinase [Gammaproteobacteria bacterium TMED219]OUX66544.1 MAG: adenylate kinase [Gammaproteobacteria bacterium TMED281]RCL38848.1 MAG: adenylate kinase [SAR86 cluster bacterium]|tara:strand:+ start:1555 stop:2187 length:633 start_codon:yes stop_codon:yes gene_type:complete